MTRIRVECIHNPDNKDQIFKYKASYWTSDGADREGYMGVGITYDDAFLSLLRELVNEGIAIKTVSDDGNTTSYDFLR